ncbi:MAG: type II RES/Xre toxin-antitoxin system antitoxin [Steroidobacteraceae bacterium]
MRSALIGEILGPLPKSRVADGAGILAKLHQLIRKGLPARVIGKLEKILGLSPPQTARLLAVSETSRKRFKQTPAKRLDEASSDRIVRIVSTVAEAAEIFGDDGKAIAWFKTPSLALNGQEPLELMTSDPGAKIVRDELNRIRYGHWA